MADGEIPNYYKTLGIDVGASKAEIRSAYRKLAPKVHPDKAKTPEDKEERMRKMKELNEAYRVLSDVEKRNEYDRDREGFVRREREGVGTRPGTTSQSYESFFRDIFTNIYDTSNPFSRGGLWDTPSKAKPALDYFMMPENDWGLLVALKNAYESKTDGKWQVAKSEGDKRDFVAEVLYSVKRKGDKVWVYRNIEDWRDEFSRGTEIEVTKEGAGWEVEKTLKSNERLGEYYLYGQGKKRLRESYHIPDKMGEYLMAMKSLAKKFALHEVDGQTHTFDVHQELKVINNYGEHGSKNTRMEGGFLSTLEDREWVRKVSFADFWTKMTESEGLVKQVEGQVKAKEGQMGGSRESKG